jgi:hypothetical protein
MRDVASREALGFAAPAGADAQVKRFHSGISAMDTEAGSRTLTRRYRDQGMFIATIDSSRAGGIEYYRSGWVGHVTLVGSPADILAAVVGVTKV